MKAKFDRIDREILRLLQEDGRLSNAQLAERVALSPSACLRRLQRLEEAGVIQGYRAVLSAEAIGRSMTVFIEVTLSSQGNPALDAFERAVAACPAVLECHLMSGDFDYLLRVAVGDMADYEHLHRQSIATLPHVARLRTAFAMRAVIPLRAFTL